MMCVELSEGAWGSVRERGEKIELVWKQFSCIPPGCV